VYKRKWTEYVAVKLKIKAAGLSETSEQTYYPARVEDPEDY
jgi:hypothetical protein